MVFVCNGYIGWKGFYGTLKKSRWWREAVVCWEEALGFSKEKGRDESQQSCMEDGRVRRPRWQLEKG
jgi:hypothetical protein